MLVYVNPKLSSKAMSATANKSDNSLLALLLALQDLEAPLSDREQSGLADVADQLYLDPDAWESDIKPSVLATIQENASLSRLYEDAKSRLDAVGHIPLDLLPTEAELEQASPNSGKMLARGFDPEGDPSDYNSHEITNVAVNVLSAASPTEMSQKLGYFEKLKQFLLQPIG